jgi:adenylate cyclase
MTVTGLTCGSCGTGLRAGDKFCHECGTPVAHAAQPAEYKQVTVLFADVVSSMDIAEAVGAERLREIMAQLVDEATAVVQRYGGTVAKFTGDGIMALFGAPTALEFHAIRACLAALDLQSEAQRLAVEVDHRDGLDLRLRVGLNSGRVVAGDIGSGAAGYTAVGAEVGMAQRMESVAPPGGVMISESTAELVADRAVLDETELVAIKGEDTPVPARRLLGVSDHRLGRRAETALVGRGWEMNTLTEILDEAIGGEGCVVNVVGSAGVGKSRLVREVAAIAVRRGVAVFSTYCEAYASDIPFHVVARLLRAATGVDGLAGPAARAHLRAQLPDAGPQDLLLLEDLLGIGDPGVALPGIDPDARRRRLTALIQPGSLWRSEPTVYLIQDVQWIDAASESMLADFVAMIPHTPSLVLITYRPDYRGVFTEVSGAQTISLRPLSGAHTAALTTQLLGSDPSIVGVADLVATRAAGNPLFVEEMARDLAERGILGGEPGAYLLHGDAVELSVPATLQATIGARIDRLGPAAKDTLYAAAVIGSRFDEDLLSSVVDTPRVGPLIEAGLIEQVRSAPHAEYAFCSPMIRTAAYESQLEADRAKLHRRLAATIEHRNPGAADQNAALIAKHLEAAGDLHAAYGWHMRAAAWSTNRDFTAAHLSWRRALQTADRLPDDDPGRSAMRILPRSLLCGSAWRVGGGADPGFDELRELCTAAGDLRSLAIGMAGMVVFQYAVGHYRQASRLATEHLRLLESIGDPTLTVALCFAAFIAKFEAGEVADVLRLAEQVIEFADDDPAMGKLIIGSPLTAAITCRGAARWCFGIPQWKDDVDRARVMTRDADPVTRAAVMYYTYVVGIPNGVVLADATAERDTAEVLTFAEQAGDDIGLALARYARGVTLVHRGGPDWERGLGLLGQVREKALQDRYSLAAFPLIDIEIATEKARSGDHDGAINLARAVVDDLFGSGNSIWSVLATAVLVQALLRRGGEADPRDAQAAVDRLAGSPTDPGFVLREIWLLRLRALLARTHGDETAYRDYRDRYRAMATELGFEGHLKWAEAMP